MKLKRFLCLALALTCCFSVCVGLCACDKNEEDDEGGAAKSNSPFYVVYKDVKIELDKKAEAVLEKLGKANYEDNLGDCGGIGIQMKYTYSDIAINTLKEKDGEMIHKISFESDLVSTPKGISIGSSEGDVRSAYGEPTSEENGKLLYKSNDLELEFTVKNGTVSAVNYRRVR